MEPTEQSSEQPIEPTPPTDRETIASTLMEHLGQAAEEHIDFIHKLVTEAKGAGATGAVNPTQVIAVMQLVCKYGQPFIDTACPIVNQL